MDVPGGSTFGLEHLVLDYNGTLACDGVLKEGVLSRLETLSSVLSVHVITADTHGSVHDALESPFVTIHVIEKCDQDKQKEAYVMQLGTHACVAVGNGFNDALMLKASALGVVLMQEEGCATRTLLASDLAFNSIENLLDALLTPNRIVASLRNS
ncbi:MAG: ATPase P [Gammaproteobacteria bacterium]|nr:ATPase P [Gammaproteobacteria bacterium]